MTSLSHPPGRAGRQWLITRLGVARRTARMLDRRRLLLSEEHHVRQAVAGHTEPEWEAAARDLERWTARARVAAGEAQMWTAGMHIEPAEVRLRWRSVMGVTCAEEPECRLPDAARAGALGGTAALDLAAVAASRAAAAAARHAAARQAVEALAAELVVTARRQRMLERRWVPRLEAALAALELRLDELERDDRIRTRWTRHRRITTRDHH
jgi:vacuolar-type H+-ATPase subunit D/Vma8